MLKLALYLHFFLYIWIWTIFSRGNVKKYNVKYAILIVLIISGIINLFLPSIKCFAIVKYLWAINGICLGLIWPTLSRFLLNNVEDGFKQKAMYVMCMSTPAGILFSYGTSALMVKLNVFKMSFYIASVLLPLIAIIWLLTSDKYKSSTQKIENEIEKDNYKLKSKIDGQIFIYLSFFALECISLQLIREGMTTWTSTILKESLNVSNSLSLLLTILLPIIAIIGPIITSFVNKKIKKILYKTFFINLIELPLLFIIIIVLKNEMLFLTKISFCFLFLTLTVLESVFTSNLPIILKEKVDYGFVNGFINGCCYIGSTISTYLLGIISDKFSWNYIFYLFIIIQIFLLVLFAIVKLSKNEIFDKML